ncbi:hypothetical protein TNCV_3527011 [Trichonephila clavipes]|nr:hypothetical protein TNCV_3527011 [Trichonephila clavipes]
MAYLTSAFLPKRLPVRYFFKAGNRLKSLGARSGLYGGWCRCSQPRAAIGFCVAVARSEKSRSLFQNRLFQFRQGVIEPRRMCLMY